MSSRNRCFVKAKSPVFSSQSAWRSGSLGSISLTSITGAGASPTSDRLRAISTRKAFTWRIRRLIGPGNSPATSAPSSRFCRWRRQFPIRLLAFTSGLDGCRASFSSPFLHFSFSTWSGRLANGETAVWAVFFYSFAPLSVFTSREFIPDTPSLSLGVIGLYFFIRWLDSVPTGQRKWAFFFVSIVCVAASVLIKLPSVLIGVPLACLVLQRFGFSSFRRPEIWLFAVMALYPAAVWYWHAHKIAASCYPYHFFGAGGVRLMSGRWYFRIARELILSSLTWPLFLASLIGLLAARSATRLHLFYWWLAAMIVFTIAVGYGNRHQWYQLPFVPIAAAFAGVGCVSIANRISSNALGTAIAASFVAVFLGCVFFAIKPLYRSPASAALRDLGLAIKNLTPRGSFVIAADIGDPTAFYYGERTGWHLLEQHGVFQGEPLTSDQAISNLDHLRARGANYLVFTWATVWWLDYYKDFAQYVQNNSVLVEATPEFRIYQLNHK